MDACNIFYSMVYQIISLHDPLTCLKIGLRNYKFEDEFIYAVSI